MNTFKNEILIKSTTENLSIIRDFTTEAAKKIGFSNEQISKIILAVDEAVTNIIKHAYHYKIDGEILVSIEFIDNKFSVTLIDKGIHFNSSNIPEPDLKKYYSERKVGGLGMYLMKKLMDEVIYSNLTDESNKVTLIKYFN